MLSRPAFLPCLRRVLLFLSFSMMKGPLSMLKMQMAVRTSLVGHMAHNRRIPKGYVTNLIGK